MTNNYAYLSFNFGPTLLTWLEKHHPQTYASILEADKQSINRLGWGNAMAQAYNHSILPLCTREDAKEQILWGLDDFSHRFGREAQGMWLPETAINPMVIDLLSEAGVKFVILSPWQGKSIGATLAEQHSLQGKPVPYNRPFLLQGKQGNSISAFFYNHQLAEGISFGHYLRDADLLYQRLLNIRNNDKTPLLHTATDGEIYGHHEPYGDMALAALIKKVQDRKDFTFTNYTAYLVDHPAKEWAVLHDGEEGKGTSWSCSHGVSRWYKDCGCHTGGDDSWNQAWRTPLRSAFDNLSKELDIRFVAETRALLGPQFDAWNMLSTFGPVASGLVPMQQFLDQYSKDAMVQAKLAKLLVGQLYKHFSYTSCGWFFNDLAGLEPRQNIAYSLMALKLYEPEESVTLLKRLLSDLDLAKANRKQDGSGQNLALEIASELPGEAEATLFFTLNRRIALKEDWLESYGYFQLLDLEEESENSVHLSIYNQQTLSHYRCTVTQPHPMDTALQYTLILQEQPDKEKQTYYLAYDDIPLGMKDLLFNQIERSICILDLERLRHLGKNIFYYSTLTKNIQYLPMGSLYQELIGSSLIAIKSLFMYGTINMWDDFKDDFALMIDFFKKYGKQSDLDLLVSVFNTEMGNMALKIQQYGLYERNCRFTLEFLQVVRERAFQPDLTHIQNAVYPYLSMQKPVEKEADIPLINTLGNVLNFDITIKSN